MRQVFVVGTAPALPRRVATVIVAALLACAAAWLITVEQAASMSGMGGVAMLSAGIFMVTWLVMMVAMMFPAVAPMVLAYASVARSPGEGAVPAVAFVAGYLAMWTAAGLVPLAIIEVLGSSAAAPISPWLPRAAAAVVLLAGAYQLTPLKDMCLRACRSPLGFVLTHDFGRGTPGAARAGMSHGLYCIGCCWALMAVLAVLGLMNIAWMAVFALIFFLEKNWRYGFPLSRLVGVACVAGGLLAIIWPQTLQMVGGPTS